MMALQVAVDVQAPALRQAKRRTACLSRTVHVCAIWLGKRRIPKFPSVLNQRDLASGSNECELVHTACDQSSYVDRQPNLNRAEVRYAQPADGIRPDHRCDEICDQGDPFAQLTEVKMGKDEIAREVDRLFEEDRKKYYGRIWKIPIIGGLHPRARKWRCYKVAEEEGARCALCSRVVQN
jgi:hypothetical protein